jgi:hypothetical protein
MVIGPVPVTQKQHVTLPILKSVYEFEWARLDPNFLFQSCHGPEYACHAGECDDKGIGTLRLKCTIIHQHVVYLADSEPGAFGQQQLELVFVHHN